MWFGDEISNEEFTRERGLSGQREEASAVGHGADCAESKETLVGGYQSEIVNLSSCYNKTVRGILVKGELLRSQHDFVGQRRQMESR